MVCHPTAVTCGYHDFYAKAIACIEKSFAFDFPSIDEYLSSKD